jgi:hypothetical protein
MPPDASHAATQDSFRAALWAEAPPAGLHASDPAEVAQRFKVYRNNVFHSLTRALAARFPVVERLVGAEFFAALARAYLAADPPQGPVLLLWGESFAPFLDGFPPVGHLPFLGDVARLEYARGRASHAADAAPVAPDALAVDNLEALHLRLHPSAHLFKSATPAVQIWRSQQPNAVRATLTAGPDHALIARRPDFAVVVEPLDSGSFAVLSSLAFGQSLGTAASHADPTPALTTLLTHSLITDVRKGPIT